MDFENLNSLVNDMIKINNSQIFINVNRNFISFDNKVKKFYKNKSKRIHLFNYNSKWGSVRHFDAFIQILNFALKKKCDYFHWIDGRTMIVVSSEKFIKFFRNKNLSYVEINPIPYKGWKYYNGGLNRIKYYHLTDFLKFDIKKYKYLFFILNHIFIFLQKIFFVNRLIFDKNFGGQAYVSLSLTAAKYLKKEYNKVKKNYKNTLMADETITQTILSNADNKLKNNLINRCLVYHNWSKKFGENPGILDIKDLKKIINSKKKFIFARKFYSKLKANNILKNKIEQIKKIKIKDYINAQL